MAAVPHCRISARATLRGRAIEHDAADCRRGRTAVLTVEAVHVERAIELAEGLGDAGNLILADALVLDRNVHVAHPESFRPDDIGRLAVDRKNRPDAHAAQLAEGSASVRLGPRDDLLAEFDDVVQVAVVFDRELRDLNAPGEGEGGTLDLQRCWRLPRSLARFLRAARKERESERRQ